MRKYFLLSAVALLAASTANAETEYAEVTVKATLVDANQFSCSDMDFGIIVLKSGAMIASTVTLQNTGEPITTGKILSVSGTNTPLCEHARGEQVEVNFPESLTLTSIHTGEEMTVTNFEKVNDNGYEFNIIATLNIPETYADDEYIGTFTLTSTY